MTTISILLVDDQPFVGLALRRLLATETDMEVHCCHEASAALDEANSIRPDVILQDLMLPGIDGLTLVGMFRANPATRATPIVVLSGNDDAETRRRAQAAGANGYLVKLPNKADLVACLRKHAVADAGGALDPAVLAGFHQGPAEMAAFTVTLIDQFIIEAQSRVDMLRDAAERRDMPALCAGAHSLKGSSAVMGAVRLGALCVEIEHQLAKGAVSPSLVTALEQELAHVRAAFVVERQRFRQRVEPEGRVPS